MLILCRSVIVLSLVKQYINLYAYCLNNPVNMIDPDVKTPIRIGKHSIEATFDVYEKPVFCNINSKYFKDRV